MISEGELRIEEIRKVDNYVKVHGKLLFHILYVTDEAEERWPNCPVSFRLRRWFIPRRRGVTG